MESQMLNLQQRLQKLIDQYTKDKKELDELKRSYAQLSDENKQLLAQIEDYSKLYTETDNALSALKKEYESLKVQHEEMQKMLMGIENFADDAIKTIDDIFPKLGDIE
nr:cell division protein ZapB [Candidatus Cloacimonadota bacterium]